jgi:PAS domain S-box-containing protein
VINLMGSLESWVATGIIRGNYVKDETKTKEQFLAELAELNREVARLRQTALEGLKVEANHGEYYRRIEELVEERTAEIRIINRQLQGEIDSRKRAEEKLQSAAGQWRDTIDAINDAVWLMDADQTILRCNKAASKLLKKDYGGIIGKKCFELVHGESSPVAGCPFLRMYASKRREAVYLPEGDRWLNVSVTPLKDRRGRVIGAIHVVSDVTKERRAREEIKESRKKLSSMLEGIGEGFLALDKELKLTYANKSAEKLLHRRGEELVGEAVSEVLPGEPGMALKKGCIEVLVKGGRNRAELFFASQLQWLEARIHPYGGGLTVCLHDITEWKEARGQRKDLES